MPHDAGPTAGSRSRRPPALRGEVESSNLYITRTELHELLARAFDAAGARDSAPAR